MSCEENSLIKQINNKYKLNLNFLTTSSRRLLPICRPRLLKYFLSIFNLPGANCLKAI